MLIPIATTVLALMQVGAQLPNPRVQAVLDRAPLPPRGDVGLTLLASADTVRVGEQLDLVTAAWFPRELLLRLRRPASLRAPTVDGVFTAVQPGTTGVAASRLVGETWYDLYLAHQVVFPLTPGVLEIPGAGLTFSVPAGRQYFSEERLYRRSTAGLRVVVLGLPPAPVGGAAVARALRVTYELSPEPARAGEPIPVELVLGGVGNVALWPTPAVVWPEGTRGYVDRSEDELRLSRGLLQGAKRFRFSVLADSAGSLVLPEVRYPFFDLGRSEWTEAIGRAVVLPVLPPRPVGERRNAPPLLEREPLGLSVWPLPVWLTALLVLAAPALTLVVRWRPVRPRRPRRGTTRPLVVLTDLVRGRVPETERGRVDTVAAAMREAGLDAETSATIAELYHEFTNRRFDPERTVSEARLEQRAGSVLKALPRRLTRALASGSVLLLIAGRGLLAQAPSPDSLYRGAVYGAAMRGFAAEVASGPHRASRWYNLGAAALAAGDDGQAAAAWLTARRLAPRSAPVATAWTRVGAQSSDLERAGRVSPLTPPELFALALIAWTAAWLVVARCGGHRVVIGLLALAGGLGASAAMVRRWYQRPVAVVTRSVDLREAPYGLAGAIGRLDELQVVRPRAAHLGWRLVEVPGGRLGWVPSGSVARAGRLDSDS